MVFWGESRVISRSRVAASRISSVADLAIAINLPEGDHVATPRKSPQYVVPRVGSHEFGNPRTTFTNGQAYWL
jgi:hypothetical protein